MCDLSRGIGMAWFGKKKDAPEDVAIAALFTAWQVGDDEPLPMLVSSSTLMAPEMKAEIACVQSFVTTVGIIHILGGRQAVCQRTLGAFHLANGILCGYASEAGVDQHAIQVIHAMQQRVLSNLESFGRRYPRERALIDSVRRHPPTSAAVVARFGAYSQAVDAAGGQLQAGLQSIGAAFAAEIGAPRNPLVAAMGSVLVMAQFRAIADSLPSYNLA